MALKTNETTFVLKEINNGFQIVADGRLLFHHSHQQPMLYVGYGEETINMYRGNFDIHDYVVERIGLRYVDVVQEEIGFQLSFSKFEGGPTDLEILLTEEDGKVKLQFTKRSSEINRLWLRVQADSNEKVYGCGEQLSHFNLRGKNFPLWTSEPGVGRNKNTYTTWQADVKDKAGGDYYNTNYPQPTFISTKKYYCHVETTAYADFDFRNDEYHELQIWDIPQYVLFETAESYVELVEKLTEVFGRQPELPDWTYNGIWLG